MGQGGSGKTAVVQEIVLPSMDFLFPAEEGQVPSSLIVCAKWSQAENISTPAHKAVSCHRASCQGIQSYRNKDMSPGQKKSALRRIWDVLRLLVLEEVSMISPSLYNMLLFCSYHGREATWEVPEGEYDKLAGAFGRMPIVIHLGDFLQLKPVGAGGLSLVADLRALEASGKDVPAEFQQAMRLFCATPFCFELSESNRFKDKRLRNLMNFMREPQADLPEEIERSWAEIQLGASDTRLQEERFQQGHMLAIYWDTVARWMTMRAQRDAAALATPLILVQAADAAVPPMEKRAGAKLLNQPNPKDTGGMHGMLAVHLGMRIRLLQALDHENGLVKDAEGDIVNVVVNPLDQIDFDAAIEQGIPQVYLRHVPLGFWVRFDKYSRAPFGKHLCDCDPSLTPDRTASLVFIEPTTSAAFKWREYTVTRTGFPFSHGRVVTSTACQGWTLHAGVVIDCGRHVGGNTPKDDDDWWLDLYVMLSRATRLEDLLLVRAPSSDFLLRGPPPDIRRQLVRFASRTKACRKSAEKLADEIGFRIFLH